MLLFPVQFICYSVSSSSCYLYRATNITSLQLYKDIYCVFIRRCSSQDMFICSVIFNSDGIREPVSGSLLYGNNIVTAAVILSSNAIGVHFYSLWESCMFIWYINVSSARFIVCLLGGVAAKI